MINISSIRQYVYCPLKFYYQHTLDEKEDENLFLNNEIRRLRIDLQELTQKNIRKIKVDMDIKEIENILLENIINYIDITIENLNKTLPENYTQKIENIKLEILSETYFSVKVLALKSKKATETLEKDGSQIVEMFFPNSIQTYLLKDLELEIIGICDKIEIIDGKYFPVQLKTSKPPIKGVWDSDAIESVANALLIEQEFDTEVFVGFIDYLQIKERRPVVMDVHLRKSLFKILKEMKIIKKDEIIPKIEINKNKCAKCNFSEICQQNI